MTDLAQKHLPDFPLLRGGDLAYLDTAATSQTPDVVVEAVDDYYQTYRANAHRGLYPAAEKATARYEEARENVAHFIGAEKDEVIFTSGATGSSNMLVYALEQTLDLNPGDEIVTTIMEHHSSLVPLQELAKREKLTIRYIPLTPDFELDQKEALALITKKTKIIAVMLASNVLGTINDIASISKKAHEVGAVMIVDATAAAGHINIDVKILDSDFLYFSGHKMCGPTGIGVLYGKKKLLETLEPGFFGGGMVHTVTTEGATWATDISRFEAGTPNIAGAIGLGAAVGYLEKVGVENIHAHVQELFSYAYDTLGSLEGVTLYVHKNPLQNIGIISFTLNGVHPHDIAQVAAQNNVAIRAGHHCAMPLHQELDVVATARASLYLYNTKDDIDALAAGVVKARNIFTTKSA